MQKVVIDTNVILSAFISPNGVSSCVLHLVYSDSSTKICYNEKIFAEYREKFLHSKFDKYNFDNYEFEKLLHHTITEGILINPSSNDIKLPDEDDRIFYDTAKKSGAILITGDKHLLNLGEDFIITPTAYLHSQAKFIIMDEM